MTKKPIPETGSAEEDYSYDQLNKINSVASATECTGLMYAPADNFDEAESYNEIYVVPKVSNEDEKKLRK